MTYVIVSSGHLRGLHGLGAAPSATVDGLLKEAEELLTQLSEAQFRIAREVDAMKLMKFGGPPTPFTLPFQLLWNKLDLFEYGARIDGMESMLRALDSFVTQVYIRVEKQARDPHLLEKARLAAAQRLKTATANILATATGTSPLADLAVDIKEAVNGILKDTNKALHPDEWKIPTWAYGLGVIAGLYYVSNILSTLKSEK